MTDHELNLLLKMHEITAKEKLTIEVVKGTVYLFGSELATLRLFRNNPKKSRQEYSLNLNKWYFCFDLS